MTSLRTSASEATTYKEPAIKPFFEEGGGLGKKPALFYFILLIYFCIIESFIPYIVVVFNITPTLLDISTVLDVSIR